VTIAERRRLTDVARGASPADLYVRGSSLLNVYTGEIYPAAVAVKGERIAYVGARDDMVGPRTRVELARAMRSAEPRVREAVAQATLLSRSFKVGVRAGAAAYRASRAPKR